MVRQISQRFDADGLLIWYYFFLLLFNIFIAVILLYIWYV